MKRNLGGLGIVAAVALLAGCQGTAPTIGSLGAKTVATAGGALTAGLLVGRCHDDLEVFPAVVAVAAAIGAQRRDPAAAEIGRAHV